MMVYFCLIKRLLIQLIINLKCIHEQVQLAIDCHGVYYKYFVVKHIIIIIMHNIMVNLLLSSHLHSKWHKNYHLKHNYYICIATNGINHVH